MTPQVAQQKWIPTDGTFGARLALIRQAMGWGNVKEAALACGVPVETWRTWERDGKTPRDLHTATMSIARATGVDPTWLAGFGNSVSAPVEVSEHPGSGSTLSRRNNDSYAESGGCGNSVWAHMITATAA